MQDENLDEERFPMEDRRVLHVGGSLSTALMLAALNVIMAKERAENKNHRSGMLVIDHRNVVDEEIARREEEQLTLSFSKMAQQDFDYANIGGNCLVCGRSCIGKDKFCSPQHRFEWKRRGR